MNQPSDPSHAKPVSNAVTPVDLFAIDLTRPADESMLSEGERTRALRLVIADAQRRYIAARAGLREILSKATGIEPAALIFGANEYGKPYVANVADAPHFNLSHSLDVALVAIASVPVGVDIEQLRWLPHLAQMAEMALTEDEQAALQRLDEDERTKAFCRIWTRKEAVMKADGAGFRMTKAFSLGADGLRQPDGARYAASVELPSGVYTVTDVPFEHGFLAAVAAKCDGALSVNLMFLD
jgi:4'-phosphopantetheinyl transferase